MKFFVVTERKGRPAAVEKLGGKMLREDRCFIKKTPFGHGDWGWRLLIEAPEPYSRAWKEEGFMDAGSVDEPLVKDGKLGLLSPDRSEEG